MYRDNGYEGIALEFQQEQMLAVKQMAESLATLTAAMTDMARTTAQANRRLLAVLDLLAEDRTDVVDPQITFAE